MDWAEVQKSDENFARDLHLRGDQRHHHPQPTVMRVHEALRQGQIERHTARVGLVDHAKNPGEVTT